MRRMFAFAAALCLLLSGCGAQERPAAEPEFGSQPALVEEPPTEEPWRSAYKQFLQELCRREAEQRNPDHPDYDPNGYLTQSAGYFLYDMNSDGVPELFLKMNIGLTEVYTFRDGEAVQWGEINTWNSGLYSDPEEKGVICMWGHSGGQSIQRITFDEDGTLREESLYEKEDLNADYIDIGAVVPGSMYLRTARTTLGRTFAENTNAEADQPLTLPIDDYGKGRVRQAEDAERSMKARAAIEAVLEGDAMLFGVSADGFGGDTGETTWEAYLAPGGVDSYAAVPQKLAKLAWTDVDGDGQVECVAVLLDEEQWPDQMVVLSEQDGAVYGYCINYMGDSALDADGVFWSETLDEMAFGLSFQKEQCYCYTAERDPAAQRVMWIEK